MLLSRVDTQGHTGREAHRKDLFEDVTHVEIWIATGVRSATRGQSVSHIEINKCSIQKVATNPGLRETAWRGLWLEIMNEEPAAGDEI